MTAPSASTFEAVDGPGLARSSEPDLAGWRTAVARAGYATVLVGAVVSTWGILRLTERATVAAGAVIFVAAMVIWVFERRLPYSATWQPTLRSFGIDLTHSIVSAYAIAPAVRGILVVALATAASDLPAFQAIQLWPDQWSVIAQLALAVVVADFGAYWAHRFMHLTRFGWRMHAVHHSLVRMNFIASARSHPFNVILTFSCETGLLILLGVPPEVMALWTVVKATNGLLQHSNVDLRPGGLSAVLATNDVHRWHHSIVPDESNHNFGNTTTLWDRLFGTLFLPVGRRGGTTLGIDDADIPEHYLTHLATPFTLSRYENQHASAPASS